MSMNPNLDETTQDKLQELLSINIDSAKGWQHAAAAVKDPSLANFFREMEQTRQQNAAELRQLVSESGKAPTEHGSISGQLHRWWIDAKQALSGNDNASILTEAERGEDSIKHTYESALSDIQDPSARTIVERQFLNVRDGHNKVKAMRDRYKNPRG